MKRTMGALHLSTLLAATLAAANAAPTPAEPPAQAQASAPAAEDEPPADPSADPRCDFAPPAAALVAARYADYLAVRNTDPSREPQELVESATLADGTRVRVLSHACVDSFGNDFEFTFGKPKHGAGDLAFWAKQTRATLDALALSEHVIGVKDLHEFLARATTLKRRGHSIRQCRDGTQPAGGECNWSSRGSLSLRVEDRGAAIQVTFGADYSG